MAFICRDLAMGSICTSSDCLVLLLVVVFLVQARLRLLRRAPGVRLKLAC
jgi:hypothetical protein